MHELVRENDPRKAKKVFIISPFHAEHLKDQILNVTFARALARDAYLSGLLPVVPHLYFPVFMQDNGDERRYGIEAGHMWMDGCGEAWLCVIDGRISDGMIQDMEYASDRLGITVLRRDWSRNEAMEYITAIEEGRK